jgi:hypothetical protein
MGYAVDLPSSARRHLEAARELSAGRRRDVAGYLYGIAVECAIKAMMVDIGLRPLPSAQRRDDPFFAHFPQLATMLRDQLRGRVSAPLKHFLDDPRFMANWSTDMRYSHGHDVVHAWVTAWEEQARQAVASIGT